MGYGQCSYLRLIDSSQKVHCSLIMAKSRVTPIKPITIPCLELTAALISVKVSYMLLEELDIPNAVEWFWTDSNVVLGLKEQLKTTECAVQDEAGTCKTIFSSDIDVVKGEEFVESEKAMENVEAMSVIANENDTEISNSPLKKPAQILQKRQSEEYIREVKRICLKDQEISELNCTDDFNWQECSDTIPKYLENTSCNQYGHNKNTLCTNEANRKEIIETMKTSETNILQEITSTDEVAPFEAKKKFCEEEEKQSDPNSLLQMICTVRNYSWRSRKKSTSKASLAMERPIYKVVLLHKTETREVPTEEP